MSVEKQAPMAAPNKSHALNFGKYPEPWARFIELEQIRAAGLVQAGDSVLDIGCGTGRFARVVGDVVSRYVGIDIEADLIAQATSLTEFENCNFHVANALLLSPKFPGGTFENSFLLWNTLGNVLENEAQILSRVRAVTTRQIVVSVLAKGSLETRKTYYEALGIPHTIDSVSETIFSETWGVSRAYSEPEVRALAGTMEVLSLELLAGVAYFAVLNSN